MFCVPGLEPRGAVGVELETSHFAERFQLFVILALGESIVVTGATTRELELEPRALAAFAVAFLGTAAMWWLYFNLRRADRRSAGWSWPPTARRWRATRYTYLHVVMVAGMIVSAVGDELVIAHPTEELHGAEVAAVVAGPAIYLLAHVLFRLRLAGTLSAKRLAGRSRASPSACRRRRRRRSSWPRCVVAVLVAVIGAEELAAAAGARAASRRRWRRSRRPSRPGPSGS